jgi:hypothetical protein
MTSHGFHVQTVQNKGEKLLSGLPTHPKDMQRVLEQAGLQLEALYNGPGLSALLSGGKASAGKKAVKGPKLPSFFR